MENALNMEHRITEVEQRSKSNSHRLEKVERIADEIHNMSNAMVQLVEEMKHTNEAVSNIDKKVDRMDSRVDEMEKSPAKKLDNLKDKIVGTAIGLIMGFFMTGLLWAAVQVF